jgi:hypothetical protein
MRRYTVYTRFNGDEVGTTVTAENKEGAKRAIGGTILRVWEVCPGCEKPKPNVGPWKEPGCPHDRLCGFCKLRRWAEKPGNVADLEAEIQTAVKATEGKP